MWTYEQSTGKLYKDGVLRGFGYSGRKEGLNNPEMQAEKGIGPIPQGKWRIGRFFNDPGGKGPIVAHLAPQGFDPLGRSGFMIHGDNLLGDNSASEGCIILPRVLRQMLRDAQSDDCTLEVIA